MKKEKLSDRIEVAIVVGSFLVGFLDSIIRYKTLLEGVAYGIGISILMALCSILITTYVIYVFKTFFSPSSRDDKIDVCFSIYLLTIFVGVFVVMGTGVMNPAVAFLTVVFLLIVPPIIASKLIRKK